MSNTNQSYWWYLPIVFVLFSGYTIGSLLAFGVSYLNWFAQITSAGARFTVVAFAMGMLGATLYSTQWWAVDMDEAIKKPQFFPHLFDAFGYALTIIGGGICGVVFYMALGLTSELVVTANDRIAVRPFAGIVIAFCGGLAQFRIRLMLTNLTASWTASVEKGGQANQTTPVV
jgi:hypothetical protein